MIPACLKMLQSMLCSLEKCKTSAPRKVPRNPKKHQKKPFYKNKNHFYKDKGLGDEKLFIHFFIQNSLHCSSNLVNISHHTCTTLMSGTDIAS